MDKEDICMYCSSWYTSRHFMETYGEGKGYYATGGKLVEIKWRLTDSGELVFEDLSSEQIVVNPGNSYIGFYKSSDSMSVSFE